MRISVVGAGYVGLVSAASLARLGHSVVCIDTDASKVDLINRGVSPIYESGLDDLLHTCVLADGSLKASKGYGEIIETDMTLICVGTPSNSDGGINLDQIRDAARAVAGELHVKQGYHVVVTRSTVVPQTTTDVVIPLLENYSGRKVGEDIGVAVNPEFLQEGAAVRAFFNPDRVIIGEYDDRSGKTVAEIYKGLTAPVVRTDMTTAEMIKYASNAFLATKVSFINEIANICQRLNIDVYDVVEGLRFDYRIGDRFLKAGIGFGGSCLPKDLRALVRASTSKLGYSAPLLRAVLEVNETQAIKMVEIAEEKLGDLGGKRVCVLGLAFKPNTDDMREAPSIRVIEALLKKGASVKAYDPRAMESARAVIPPGVEYCSDATQAISDSDCVLILTEWDEFKDEEMYEGKTVIDGRRALDPRRANAVCDYHGVCW